MNDNITIIHGPNGIGKTMILKLLDALFGQNNNLLLSIPFDEFRVDFEDGTSFWISKTPRLHDSIEGEHTVEQTVTFQATDRDPYRLDSKSLYSIAQSALRWSQSILYYAGHEPITSNDLYSLTVTQDDSKPFVILGKGMKSTIEARKEIPGWLIEMRNSVTILLIETQRLLSPAKSSESNEKDTERSLHYAVTDDSEHLTELIRKKLAESATLSQSLDRTFPIRLISPTPQQEHVTENELRRKLGELDRKRSRLMNVGLLDQATETPPVVDAAQEIEPNTKAVLAVYAQDTEQKLGIFDELAQKIDLFTTIINNRFLYKKMSISKEKGIVITSKNGAVLPLESLSSGEQHELVLFYELLFRVSAGSLILIDEPELSLHIVWQEQFLKDVQQITQLADIDIILATHSPDLISDRRDLVVELEGPKNGRV